MGIPKAYLTTVKNLEGVLSAIQQAKAPERFTVRFLESLGFKSNSDRLVLGVLKALGFLDDQGKPTDRYFAFLDQTQSKKVLAQAVEEAYADLFEVNKNAQRLDKADIKNKLKTLSQGQYSDSVVDKMAMTFNALASQSDFGAARKAAASNSVERETQAVPSTDREQSEDTHDANKGPSLGSDRIELGGLHYNIQIILPESRDPQVYDALFRSLREHLR
jgi:hypothetical protein